MMRTRLMLVLPLLGVAACSAKGQGNAAGNSLSQPTAETLDSDVSRQQAYLEQLSPSQGWRQTTSGLRYRRTGGTGQGPKPTIADTVSITYSGKLIDGTEFDASAAPTDLPLQALIAGWKEGIPLMSVGDTYEFAIPSDLGYGPYGMGPIPGGATLLFTVQLVGIKH